MKSKYLQIDTNYNRFCPICEKGVNKRSFIGSEPLGVSEGNHLIWHDESITIYCFNCYLHLNKDADLLRKESDKLYEDLRELRDEISWKNVDLRIKEKRYNELKDLAKKNRKNRWFRENEKML